MRLPIEFVPDLIRVDAVPVSCVIGILPAERRRAQPLYMSAEVSLDLTAAAVSGELRQSLDYGELAHELSFILKAGRFRLLETAALALCCYVLAKDGTGIKAAGISLAKPEALKKQGLPSVFVRRTAQEVARFRKGEVVFRTPEIEVLRGPADRRDSTSRKRPGVAELVTQDGVVLRVITRKREL